MKVVNKLPPNFAKIDSFLPDSEKHQAVFAYGDTIYNPFGSILTADREAHETIHSIQQGNNPGKWWDKYLKDPDFRLKQELEAYRGQYKMVKKLVKDREMVHWLLTKCAESISSALYGNIITYQEAYKQIKNG